MRVTAALRRHWLKLLQWRTLCLIESVDKEGENLCWTRDSGIPRALSELSSERSALLKQLETISKELGDLPMQPTTPSLGQHS